MRFPLNVDGMKKYVSRAVWLALFIVGLCAIYSGLDYIIVDDTAAQTRVTFHDFYKEAEIDYLFVGTSHMVQGVNAAQLSEDLDATVFNLSSSFQDAVSGYYLIKEALNSKEVNHVIYELSIAPLRRKNTDKTSTYIISDYMRSPLIRTEYLMASFGSDNYVNAFSRLRRNVDPQKLPDFEKMDKIYTKKSKPEYYQYLGTDAYIGKGQWAVTSGWGYGGTAALNLRTKDLTTNYTVDDIQEKEWKHFLKIIELCTDKGVDLTFYITPYSELYLMNFEQYEITTQRLLDVAEANDINVIDLNRVKEDYLTFELSDFQNADHINQAASEKIAVFLAQYIRNPDGDYFYDGIHDKYPMNDEIIAAGYNRFFLTDKGEYEKKDEAKGTITSLRLEISAVSWVGRPVDVRMWATVQSKEDESVWTDGDEIPGEKLDDYFTQFAVPYNNLKTYYRVDLLDPDTNEVLYETVTRFDMD